jgi:hypothetical protein
LAFTTLDSGTMLYGLIPVLLAEGSTCVRYPPEFAAAEGLAVLLAALVVPAAAAVTALGV